MPDSHSHQTTPYYCTQRYEICKRSKSKSKSCSQEKWRKTQAQEMSPHDSKIWCINLVSIRLRVPNNRSSYCDTVCWLCAPSFYWSLVSSLGCSCLHYSDNTKSHRFRYMNYWHSTDAEQYMGLRSIQNWYCESIYPITPKGMFNWLRELNV